jgi:hypothetical protein
VTPREIMDETRLLVAKCPDDACPQIVGAYPESMWEILPPEEWDWWKRDTAERFYGPDWTQYEYIEVVVTIPCRQLDELFRQEIAPTSVRLADT